jgi:hypothetical protein
MNENEVARRRRSGNEREGDYGETATAAHTARPDRWRGTRPLR